MNDLEQIMAKYSQFEYIFDDNMPRKLHGLIHNKTIYINAHLSYAEKKATLLEEIGHYYMTVGDISDYADMKEEKKARLWSYEKLVTLDKLKQHKRSDEPILDYELAEQFDVPKHIILEAINMYEVRGEL